MSCHPHDTSSGDGGVSDSAKLVHFFEICGMYADFSLGKASVGIGIN